VLECFADLRLGYSERAKGACRATVVVADERQEQVLHAVDRILSVAAG
jgi:hypothetical protein